MKKKMLITLYAIGLCLDIILAIKIGLPYIIACIVADVIFAIVKRATHLDRYIKTVLA